MGTVAQRRIAPIVVAVVIAGIVIGAVRLSSAGGSAGVTKTRATILHLGSSAHAATMSATAELSAPAQPYKLTGTLPDGQPPDSPVWHLRPATTDDVTTVAAALHLDGQPVRVDGGWVMRAADNRLVVRDDGSWSYGMDCAPDQPVSDEDITVGCAYASSSGVVTAPAAGAPPSPEPIPTPQPGPTDAEARTAAAAVFAALGLGDAHVTVYSGDPMSTVQAAPIINGTATSGWVTSVQVAADQRIGSADGWVDAPSRSADYPLVSAQRAFDLLQAQPRPMIEMCMQRTDGKPGCADIPPAEVTDASLGLSLDHDGNRPVLVPAWLFAIRGQDEPVAQVAVDPALLR